MLKSYWLKKHAARVQQTRHMRMAENESTLTLFGDTDHPVKLIVSKSRAVSTAFTFSHVSIGSGGISIGGTVKKK